MTFKNKKDCELSGTNIPDFIGHVRIHHNVAVLTDDQVQTMSDDSNRLTSGPPVSLVAIMRVDVASINPHPFITTGPKLKSFVYSLRSCRVYIRTAARP
jgi:hypothetical protein